jgi:hypothetical protein
MAFRSYRKQTTRHLMDDLVYHVLLYRKSIGEGAEHWERFVAEPFS